MTLWTDEEARDDFRARCFCLAFWCSLVLFLVALACGVLR